MLRMFWKSGRKAGEKMVMYKEMYEKLYEISSEIDSSVDTIIELGNCTTEADVRNEATKLMRIRDELDSLADDNKTECDNAIYDLEHSDFVNLICGLKLTHNVISFLENNGFNDILIFHGGFDEYYEWSRSGISAMNDNELYYLYLSLKVL